MEPAAGQSSHIVRPRALRWYHRAVATLVFALIRAVSVTLRYEWRDLAAFQAKQGGQPVIFSTWHNRLALCLEVWRLYARNLEPNDRLAAMVSASKDGGILARILEHYGVQPVRGSTSRRGRQALLELTTWAEHGYHLAITPDGPRGPRYGVQAGVISLAQVTGLPILPVSYRMGWKLVVRSWDRFQIPLPFSRCTIEQGDLLRVPGTAADDERERLRQQLEERLAAITRD